MPAYNASSYISEAISSVINQTYSNWELLIIDDGSIDHTTSISRQYESEKIIIYSRDKLGQSAQLNYGISKAKGEYIAIAHADDVNYPERIRDQVIFLKQNESVDICGAFANVISDNTTEIRKYSTSPTECYLSLFYGNPIIHPTAMMKKSVLERLPYIYNPDYTAAEDYDLWIRLADIACLANLDKILLDYRIHKHSNSSNRKVEEQILEKCIRLNFIKQLLKVENRKNQIAGYYFFYRSRLINPITTWKTLLSIKKAFEFRDDLDVNKLNSFLKDRFIAIFKQKRYHSRLVYSFLFPILFIAFKKRDALSIIKTLYFLKS